MSTNGALNDNGVGFGAIIRDETGEPSSAMAGSSAPGSIILHELQGVEAGLKLVIKNDCEQVSLLSEASPQISSCVYQKISQSAFVLQLRACLSWS